ncbi:hypothetical protein EJ02DRAFT_429056 [Clathrospora elynae]|uniref:Integrase catalytic domain-containing protein n=1 Tax=Clathrospora elynae TaxID=706981 RepID=A0A6A5S215_9PLEO|nr:hypothetical protein EJ02DRAFT_429056 [Clathrospora elynae]
MPLQPRTLTKPQLHVLMAHAGSDAIDHLADNVIGIEPPQGSAPLTINCKDCLQNKAHQIISRRIGHELGASRLFETVAIDLIQLDATGYNGHQYVFHGFDLFTKFNFVYTIPQRNKATLLEILTRLDRAIKRKFNTTVVFLIADDEKAMVLQTIPHEHTAIKKEPGFKSEHHTLRSRMDQQSVQARISLTDLDL